MALLLNLCIGLVLFAGLGTAISVPFLVSGKKSPVSSLSKSSGGGVHPVSISECTVENKSSNDSIPFGSVDNGNICWTLEPKEVKVNQSGEYTSLFQEKGRSDNQEGNSEEDQGKGKTSCLNVSESGTLSNDTSGAQYLGLCGSANIDNTKFVKKVQGTGLINNKESWTLWLCDKDCGTPDLGALSVSPRVLQEEKSKPHGGKKVLFYKN